MLHVPESLATAPVCVVYMRGLYVLDVLCELYQGERMNALYEGDVVWRRVDVCVAWDRGFGAGARG